MKFCPACEALRTTKIVERAEGYVVRGRWVSVPVRFEACVVCGEAVGSDAEDDAVLAAVYAKRREMEADDEMSTSRVADGAVRILVSKRCCQRG